MVLCTASGCTYFVRLPARMAPITFGTNTEDRFIACIPEVNIINKSCYVNTHNLVSFGRTERCSGVLYGSTPLCVGVGFA